MPSNDREKWLTVKDDPIEGGILLVFEDADCHRHGYALNTQEVKNLRMKLEEWDAKNARPETGQVVPGSEDEVQNHLRGDGGGAARLDANEPSPNPGGGSPSG
jgi:hypothetical protein